MKIERELKLHEIRSMLETYIYAELYQYFDHGMDLEQCAAEGADIPELTDDNIYSEIKERIEYTLDEFFDEGWPNGGIPHGLSRQVIDWVDKAMKLYIRNSK